MPYGRPALLSAYVDGSFAGFSISYLLQAGKFQEVVLEGHPLPPSINDVLYADNLGTLGVLKTVAVDPSLQGRGVGTALIKEGEKRLSKVGASLIVVPAWERADGNLNIGGVLEHLGYTSSAKIEYFWKQDCDAGSFVCPERTKCKECVCHVILFRKAVSA